MKKEANYLEVLAAIKVQNRTFWTRIGAAFPTNDGKGYRLKLDYFPASPDTEIVILPPKQSEGEGQ